MDMVGTSSRSTQADSNNRSQTEQNLENWTAGGISIQFQSRNQKFDNASSLANGMHRAPLGTSNTRVKTKHEADRSIQAPTRRSNEM